MSNLLSDLNLGSQLEDIAVGLGIFAVLIGILALIVVAFYAVVWCVIYERANAPAVAFFVPFWNSWCYFKMIYGHGWLFLIPGVNLVLSLAAPFVLAKVFDREISFAIGILFLPIIFLPMLAFSSESQYTGPLFD